MDTIRLTNGSWDVDYSKRLGKPGGFGEVFRGQGQNGPVAIKRLKVTAGQAAHRELSIGEGLYEKSLPNIVPVLDYGKDANTDSYFIVMPVCDKSLADHLATTGPLPLNQALDIARDIAEGLISVSNIVHRDLKPHNILLLNGKWCLADFGISKFVEDSTSLETLRRCLTASYAAPEQWKGERPTKAADIYALGCILHAILDGKPPFSGSRMDLEQLHKNTAAPSLSNGPPMLKSIVTAMLRKSPQSRPSIERFKSILDRIPDDVAVPRRNKLAAADERVAMALAEAEATKLAADNEAAAYKALFEAASEELTLVAASLMNEIIASAPNAVQSGSTVKLGHGSLEISKPEPYGLDAYKRDIEGNDSSKWTVAAFAKMAITNHNAYPRRPGVMISGPVEYVWSATLVYARLPNSQDYRWYEIGFWAMMRSTGQEPSYLPPSQPDFHYAIGMGMHTFAKAYGPFPIDSEDMESFQDRAIELFSRASSGLLIRPSSMPIRTNFFE